MRKNLKSLAPTLWFVIAAFIISIFAVWGGAGRLGESRASNVLASVGKDKISADFYFQSLRQKLEALRSEFKDLNKSLIQQLNVPQQVLEQLIQQSLLLQTARELGITASDREIREKIMSYPVFQRENTFIGFNEYKKILDYNRIPLAVFEENLKKEIVLQKLIDVLTAGITVTEEEVWQSYQKNHETAKFEYVILETEKVELKEDPSPGKIKDDYENNKSKYIIPEKREGIFVFFNFEDLKKDMKLNESEVEKYYKDNLSQFEEPEKIKVSRIYLPLEGKDKELVRTEIQNILDRINKGEDFGGLAKRYSKDEKATESGDWGFFEWKRLSSQEQDTITNLAQGQVSNPVEFAEGFSLLKVTEKDPAVQKTLDEVKPRIESVLKDQKARELAEKEMAQLEKTAKKEKSLDVAAQKLGVKIQSSGLLKESEPIVDIDPSGSISQSLFKLKEKALSPPVYTYKGTALAQLQKIEPPRPAKFEEVKDEVKDELFSRLKKETAFARIGKIHEELENTDLEKLAAKYGLEYKTVEEHKREQYLSIIGENAEVDQLAFSLPIGQASQPVEYEGGYAVIRVLNRKEVTRDDFTKERKTEKENLLEAEKNKFFQSLLLKLREEKGVKIKYDLFLKINQDILSRFTEEK